MDSILEKIYNDKTLLPAGSPESEEYKLALSAYLKQVEDFKAGLDAGLHECLENLMDCRGTLENVKENHCFMQAVKLGAKLAVELLK